MSSKTLRRLSALALVVALVAPWASAAPMSGAVGAGPWWVSWVGWLVSLWEKESPAGGETNTVGECVVGTCTYAGPLGDPLG